MARFSKLKQKLLLVKLLQDSRKRQKERQREILFLLQERQMLLLQVFFLTALLLSSENSVVVRYCRRLLRHNYGWFEHAWNPSICPRQSLVLLRHTVTEDPVSAAFRLAVCLYRFSLFSSKGSSLPCSSAVKCFRKPAMYYCLCIWQE